MEQREAAAAKATAVREMFDSIAPRYDVLNRVLSFGFDGYWRRYAMRAVLSASPRKVLDLACGTGDMTRLLLKKSAGCEKVYAVDASHQMLLRARAKSWPEGKREKVHFVEAVAESLPLTDCSVDSVMVAFGIRNFADRSKALQEMWRVLRPGCRLVVLEFSTPHGAIFRRLYRFYFNKCLPPIGGWVSRSKAAYEYLPESVYAFPEGEAFKQELREAGFVETYDKRLTGGIATLYEAQKPFDEVV